MRVTDMPQPNNSGRMRNGPLALNWTGWLQSNTPMIANPMNMNPAGMATMAQTLSNRFMRNLGDDVSFIAMAWISGFPVQPER